MKIGMFADAHYCSKEKLCDTRRPVLSYNKIKEAVDDFIKNKVSLIVCLGDLIDDDSDNDKNIANLEKISLVIHDSGIECICCMGNHDAFLFSNEDFEEISDFNIAPFTTVINNVRLIFLDANYTKDDERYTKENLDWTDSNVSKKDVESLKRTLENCVEKKIIVFSHQNLDPSVGQNHIIKNAAEIRKILSDDGRVTAIYQGHYHYGAENCIDNISYITLKAMCISTENTYLIIEI